MERRHSTLLLLNQDVRSVRSCTIKAQRDECNWYHTVLGQNTKQARSALYLIMSCLLHEYTDYCSADMYLQGFYIVVLTVECILGYCNCCSILSAMAARLNLQCKRLAKAGCVDRCAC